MKKLIRFPSIEQFKSIVHTINHRATYVGKDEKGNPIYNPTLPKPILKFVGFIKLHGTNFGINFNNVSGMWCQSRERIITSISDNAESAFFAESNKEVFLQEIYKFSKLHNIDLDNNTLSIYFEWVGKGIQKGVAIAEIEKATFVIGAKVTPFEESLPSYWLDSSTFKNIEHRIFNIEDFPKFEIEIDFNNPNLSVNKILEQTLEVERECPVGKAFGISSIGEGIVYNYFTEDGQRIMFKSKGELHSKSSKVVTLKEVDNEKINKTIQVANQVCPNWRLEQMLEQTFDLMNGGTLDVKKTGEYIKNVIQDILKEELLTLSENNLTPKDINSNVSQIAKNYLFNKLNEF